MGSFIHGHFSVESSSSLLLDSSLTSIGVVSMLSRSVLVQAGGGGSRDGSSATDGGVVVARDSYYFLPVVTTSSV